MPDAPYAWHQEKSSEEDAPVSVHQIFQLWQEAKISEGAFVKALGGEGAIPPAALRLIRTDPELSFAKFTRACGLRVAKFYNCSPPPQRAGGCFLLASVLNKLLKFVLGGGHQHVVDAGTSRAGTNDPWQERGDDRTSWLG